MARKFAATTDVISYPSDSGLNVTGDISIDCWVKPTSASKPHQFVNKKASAAFLNSPYILHSVNEVSPFRIQFYKQGAGSGANVVSTGRLTTGIWTHIGVSYRASDARHLFYFNGVPNAQVFGSIITGTTNTAPMQIGSRNDNQLTDMVIAHVCIHNVVLTAGEFTQAMSRGYVDNGLIFYAPLYGASTVEADLSSSARVSTVTNTTVAAGPPVVPYVDSYKNAALWYSLQSSAAVAQGLPPKSRFNIPRPQITGKRATIYP